MIRRLRLDILAAYAIRFVLTAVSAALVVLPRQHKVTMLTRQSSRPPSDFVLLRSAILRADPSVRVVLMARMVPPGVIPKLRYVRHLLRELYHVATSRLLIVDGYSIVASAARHSRGLTIVQVWHALGSLKKFGLSMLGRPGGRDPRLARAMRMHSGYDLVITSAESSRDHYAEAFGVSKSRVVVAPLPRVDRLRDQHRKRVVRSAFTAQYPELNGKRIALFAPTLHTPGAAPEIDPVALTEALDRVGLTVIIKLHPLAATPQHPALRTAPGMSTQDLLLVADVFITDFSSTVFEAAVARVPSYVLASERLVRQQDFYLNYPEELGLPFARSIPELATMLAEADRSSDIQRSVDLCEAYVPAPIDSDAPGDALARVLMPALSRGKAPVRSRLWARGSGSRTEVQLGRAAEADQNWRQAAQHYRRALLDDPNNPQLSLSLSLALDQLKRGSEAQAYAQAAIDSTLRPSYDAKAAFRVHPTFFAARHQMAEFIVAHRAQLDDRVTERMSRAPHIASPTKVFVFWDRPESMPDIVRRCRESLYAHVGDGYELVELTAANVRDYVDLSDIVVDMLQPYPAQFSDYLRCRLLQQYGGLWLDATCYLTAPLSQATATIRDSDAFLFTYSGSRVGNWFFWSRPDSYILNAITETLTLWWERESRLTNYFMWHDIAEMLYWTDERYRSAWDAMPKTHPRVALRMLQELGKPYDSARYDEIVSTYFVQKLTYKLPPDVFRSETFARHILDSPIPGA